MPAVAALAPVAMNVAGAVAARYLPHLLARFGGKHGPKVMNEVVEVLGDVTGLPASASIDDFLALLEAQPERETELRVRLEGIALTAFEAELRDRDSARQFQVQGGNRTATALLGFVVVGLVATAAVILFGALPSTVNNLAFQMNGFFMARFNDAFAFFFGSSVGSKQKDADMADALKEAATRMPPPAPAPKPLPVPPVAPPAAQPGLRPFAAELKEEASR